ALRRSLSWVCRQRRWAALHPWRVGAVALVALTIGITAAGVITSRDPLPVRLSQEGAAAYAEGKYDDAADYFEQSYRKSRDPKTLLKLVHVWIQLDKTDDALKTLDEAQDIFDKEKAPQDEALLKAALAYCANRQRSLPPAAIIKLYEAIPTECRTAAVLNNMGWTYRL